VTPSNPNGKGRDPFTIFLLAACLALSALVVVLAWQNWTMKRELARGHAPEAPDALAPGDVVPPFDVVDSAGKVERIAFGDGTPRTLLLVFSTTCPACKVNMPIWNELLARPIPPSMRVVGIQTDAGAAHAGGDPVLPFSVFTIDRSRGASLEKIPFIPATVVLDAAGTVVAAWFGVLTDEQQAELARQLAAT